MTDQIDGFNKMKEWLTGEDGLATKTGLSIEKIARRSGFSKAMFYYYLNDNYRPSPENLAKLCKTLGVSLEEGLRWVTPRPAGRPVSKKNARRYKSLKEIQAER